MVGTLESFCHEKILAENIELERTFRAETRHIQ